MEYIDINLTFENEFDKDDQSPMLAFVYQEYFNPHHNRLICFNIQNQKVEASIVANPQYTDNLAIKNGLVMISFCRSAEFYKPKNNKDFMK